MKKIVTIILTLFIATTLVSCQTKKEDQPTTDSNSKLYLQLKLGEDSKYGYEELPNQNVLIESNLKTVKQHIEKKESFVLYIGRPTCPHCQDFAPKLNDAAKDLGYSVVYLNYTKEADAQGKLTEEIIQFFDEINVQSVPNVLVYKNGEIVDQFDSSSSERSAIQAHLKNVK